LPQDVEEEFVAGTLGLEPDRLHAQEESPQVVAGGVLRVHDRNTLHTPPPCGLGSPRGRAGSTRPVLPRPPSGGRAGGGGGSPPARGPPAPLGGPRPRGPGPPAAGRAGPRPPRPPWRPRRGPGGRRGRSSGPGGGGGAGASRPRGRRVAGVA